MKRRTSVIAPALCTARGGWTDAPKEAKSGKMKQIICPVMGGTINKVHFAGVKGKRIYVFCSTCIKKIKPDPTNIERVEDAGIVLDKTPAKK